MLNRRMILSGAAMLPIVGAKAADPASEPWSPHWSQRGGIIRLQAQARGQGGIALIGDSITEVMWWPELSGMKTVNLGFGSARVRNLLTYIDDVLAQTKPEAAIIMASINNAIGSLAPDEHAAFVSEYRTLVRKVAAVTPRVALMTITPIEAGKVFSATYENARVVNINQVVRDLSVSDSLRLYDAHTRLIGPGMTIDGVHLSGPAYEKLRPLYETAARDLLT